MQISGSVIFIFGISENEKDNLFSSALFFIVEKETLYAIFHYLLQYDIVCFRQSSTEALIAATSYLDLFLRSITDVNLMKVFLEFIMVERSDGTPILDLLVSRISHESQVLK